MWCAPIELRLGLPRGTPCSNKVRVGVSVGVRVRFRVRVRVTDGGGAQQWREGQG